MTRRQLIQRIERVLLRRRDALRQSLSDDFDELSPADQLGVGDSVDAALDTDSREMYSRLAEAESRELSRVERALERFREGRYGVCEICGRSIPAPRLQALPYATTCIQCQRLQEQADAAEEPAEHWSRLPEIPGGPDERTIDSIDHAFG